MSPKNKITIKDNSMLKKRENNWSKFFNKYNKSDSLSSIDINGISSIDINATHDLESRSASNEESYTSTTSEVLDSPSESTFYNEALFLTNKFEKELKSQLCDIIMQIEYCKFFRLDIKKEKYLQEFEKETQRLLHSATKAQIKSYIQHIVANDSIIQREIENRYKVQKVILKYVTSKTQADFVKNRAKMVTVWDSLVKDVGFKVAVVHVVNVVLVQESLMSI